MIEAIHAIAQASGQYAKLLEIGELESRVAALEAARKDSKMRGRRLPARLAQLERKKQDQEDQPRHYVLTVGEEPPEDIREWDTVIYLPRKAPSVEAWVAQCRARFPHWYGQEGHPCAEDF